MAWTVSQFGDAFDTVALALLVYSLTGSGLRTGPRSPPSRTRPSTSGGWPWCARARANLGARRAGHRGSLPDGGDPRGRHTRALAIRTALADGYDPIRLADARNPNPSPTLFGLTDLVLR